MSNERSLGPMRAFLFAGDVVLLPVAFSGHPRLTLVDTLGNSGPGVTSSTPEPISYWRAKMEKAQDLLTVPTGKITKFARDLADSRKLGEIKGKATGTLENMKRMRESIDHMKAMLPEDSGDWNVVHVEIAKRLKALSAKYTKMAVVIYGNSYPLNPATQQPVVSGAMHEVPAMGAFGYDDALIEHELSGMAFGLAYQNAATFASEVEAYNLQQEMCRRLDPELDNIPDYCAKYGVFPAPEERDDEFGATQRGLRFGADFGLEPITMIIIAGIALTVVALYYAYSWSKSSKADMAEAEASSKWSDSAMACVSAGGNPNECLKSAAAIAPPPHEDNDAMKWAPLALGITGLLIGGIIISKQLG